MVNIPNFFEVLTRGISEARRERNQLKSSYRKLREDIKHQSKFEVDFPDTSSSGDLVEYIHYKIESKLRTECYIDGDGKYDPVGADIWKFLILLNIQIGIIRIRNFLSLIIWIAFLLTASILLVAVSSGVAAYIETLLA